MHLFLFNIRLHTESNSSKCGRDGADLILLLWRYPKVHRYGHVFSLLDMAFDPSLKCNPLMGIFGYLDISIMDLYPADAVGKELCKVRKQNC